MFESMDNIGKLIGIIIFILIIPIQVFFHYIQFSKILPEVRKNRGSRFWDYVPGTHQWGITVEYRKLFSNSEAPYKWYRIQKASMILNLVLGILLMLCFLIVAVSLYI
jgi:hypothetical protein